MPSSSRSSRRTKPTVDPGSKPRPPRVPRIPRKNQPRNTRNTRKDKPRNTRNTRKDRPRNTRNTRIRVLISDGRGRSVRAPGLAAWLARVAPRNAPPEVTIALVSDARIRALNKQFRRKDAVTDVLSFDPSD